MEGIAGVVDGEDVSPGHGEYECNRSLITAEANAAVRGVYACDPGAQVLVTEAHGVSGTFFPSSSTGVPSCCAASPSQTG